MNTKELILIIAVIIVAACIIVGCVSGDNYSNKNITANNTTNTTNETNNTDDTTTQTSEQSNTQSEHTSSQKTYKTTEKQPHKSAKQNNINYDPELNVYYDSNRVIVNPDGKHPQNVGYSYDYIASLDGEY